MESLIICSQSQLERMLTELAESIVQRINPKNSSTTNLSINEILTIKEVSQILNISNTTIHTWSNQGILVKHKIGRKTRFKKEEVLSALTQLETKKSKSWKR